VLGGALGWGLTDTIVEAYRILVFAYEPGDEISIFGFSRGAYTARSLAGFIRSCGIAPRRHVARIPEALARYLMIAPLLNRGSQFHDADLSRSVKSARHAVAIDERRRTFPPTLWANLDQLNGAGTGDLPYQQKWFPGDHGSVGGGGDRVGLSSITLEWIATGAQSAGLDLSWAVIADLAAGKNHREALVNKTQPPAGIAALMAANQRDRAGPTDLADMSDAAIARWFEDPDYRPTALDSLYAQLYRLTREERAVIADRAVSLPTAPAP
jgi:uncharacterized protein (DUF2235 family)